MNTINICAPRANANDDMMVLMEYTLEENAKVQKGDVVAILESSKAAIEVIAPYAGSVKNFNYSPGKMVNVGDPLMTLETEAMIDIEENTSSLLSKSQKENKNRTSLRAKLDAKQNNKSTLSSSKPPYLLNYIDEFPHIPHGSNCYIAYQATLTNVILGEQVWVNRNATIYSNNSENPIKIGSGSYIGPYVWIEGSHGINIGSCVHIAGPSTCLYTHSGMKIALQGENVSNPGLKNRHTINSFSEPISIGNNVWIGPNCTLFPGVHIQDYVVVLPNTLVKAGSIPSYSLVRSDGSIEKNSLFIKNLTLKKSS